MFATPTLEFLEPFGRYIPIYHRLIKIIGGQTLLYRPAREKCYLLVDLRLRLQLNWFSDAYRVEIAGGIFRVRST